MWQPSGISGLQMWISEPRERPKGRTMPFIQFPRLPYSEQGPRDVKKPRSRRLAPDSWDAYERNDFSEPRHLHFPIHKRALNSLIWDTWFSSINNNLWYSDYLPFAVNFYLTWLLPTHLLANSSLRVTWDAVSLAWRPENSHKYKVTLNFQVVTIFLADSRLLFSLHFINTNKMLRFKEFKLNEAVQSHVFGKCIVKIQAHFFFLRNLDYNSSIYSLVSHVKE